MVFCRRCVRRAGLHAHPYSSKFPPLAGEFAQQIRRPLPDERRRGTACRDELQFLRSGIGDADMKHQRGGKRSLKLLLQADFALPPPLQFSKGRFGAEYLL